MSLIPLLAPQDLNDLILVAHGLIVPRLVRFKRMVVLLQRTPLIVHSAVVARLLDPQVSLAVHYRRRRCVLVLGALFDDTRTNEVPLGLLRTNEFVVLHCDVGFIVILGQEYNYILLCLNTAASLLGLVVVPLMMLNKLFCER
jgi:hypothetical protein